MNYLEYKEKKTLRYVDSFKNNWRIFPPSLHVSLTDTCFNQCSMCSHWKREVFNNLDIDTLLAFLSFGKISRLETVCYTGGDPLAYNPENLNRLHIWHEENKIDYGIVTAGYLPQSSSSFIADASFIRVSLDTVDEEAYRKIRGGGISLSFVLSSMKKMCKMSSNVELGITLQRSNQYNLKEVFDFAIANKIKEVRCWLVRGYDLSLFPNDDESLGSTLMQYVDKFEDHGISHNLYNAYDDLMFGEGRDLDFNSCYACLYQLYIEASGDIFACCIVAGDTDTSPHRYAKPFDNIENIVKDRTLMDTASYWRDKVWPSIMHYSSESLCNLPAICDEGCITRLSAVNHFAQSHWGERNFI